MKLGFIKTDGFCLSFRFSFSFILVLSFFTLSCSLSRNFSNNEDFSDKKNIVKNLKKNSLKQKIIKKLLLDTEDFQGRKENITNNKIKKILELGYDLSVFQSKAFPYIKRNREKIKNEFNDESPKVLRDLLVFLSLNKAFNENEKILIRLKNRQDFLEENFPGTKKEITFYFDNVKVIKNDFKSEEILKDIKLVKNHTLKWIKNNKNWLSQDQIIFELKEYFLPKRNSGKLKNKNKNKNDKNHSNFIPFSILDGTSVLRKNSYLLNSEIRFTKSRFLICRKNKIKFDEEFCYFDLFLPLFIKFKENSLSLIHYLKEKNIKNKPINLDDLSTFFEVISLNLKLEKLLKEIKSKNLNSIKKIKINDRLGVDGKRRLILNQAFLELLNFHYEVSELLRNQYLKQKKKYNLKDSAFVRIKMKMVKLNKKRKSLKRVLNLKASARLDIILNAKGNKLKNKGRVKYINLLLDEMSSFRKEELRFKSEDLYLKINSKLLNSIRKNIGKLVYEERGNTSFYWSKELDESVTFSIKKSGKFTRSSQFLKSLKPLYLVLGKFKKPLYFISDENNYWDHVGVFLGFNKQLLNLGLTPKKGPYFWRNESVTKGKNLLTILNDKADIISVSNYGKMFQDVMILKYENGFRDKDQIRALWKDAIDLEGKKYKTKFDLLVQGKTIHEKMIKDLFPRLNLGKKIFWRSPVVFPGQIASLVGSNGPFKPVYLSVNGKIIKGSEAQLVKVSKCIQGFYCQKKLFQKINDGEDYLLWLQTGAY